MRCQGLISLPGGYALLGVGWADGSRVVVCKGWGHDETLDIEIGLCDCIGEDVGARIRDVSLGTVGPYVEVVVRSGASRNLR